MYRYQLYFSNLFFCQKLLQKYCMHTVQYQVCIIAVRHTNTLQWDFLKTPAFFSVRVLGSFCWTFEINISVWALHFCPTFEPDVWKAAFEGTVRYSTLFLVKACHRKFNKNYRVPWTYILIFIYLWYRIISPLVQNSTHINPGNNISTRVISSK